MAAELTRSGGSASDGPLPEVTVVIPSKDRPAFVDRAVRVACEQRGVDVEVIVIDDGSEPPVALSIADRRVRVLRNDAARGVAAARNRGVFEARAPWVAFLDDDDLWSPTKLRVQLDAVREWDARWCHPGTYWLSGKLGLRFEALPAARWTTAEVLRSANIVGSPSGVLASTDLVRSVGGFDGTFSTFADWDLWLRMADLYPALAVRDRLLGYVTHSGSMHRQPLRPLLSEWRRFGRRHHERGRLGGADLWEWVADSKRDERQPLIAASIAFSAALRWGRPDVALGGMRSLARSVIPRRKPIKAWRRAPWWIRRWQSERDLRR